MKVNISHQRRNLDLVATIQSLPVVGDLLGPLIGSILNILGLGSGGPALESVPQVTSEQVEMLFQAMQKAAGGLRNMTSGAAGTLNGVTPPLNRRDFEASTASTSVSLTSQIPAPSSASSTSGTGTSLEALGLPASLAHPTPPVAVPAPPVAPPALPIAPPALPISPSASPSIPSNPPNSPAAPPAAPPAAQKPPVPIGVSPPSAPIPRNAPPMFAMLKAADVISSSSSTSMSSTSTSLAAGTSNVTAPQTIVTSQSAEASASSVPA
ncbi:hypothetical protein BC628DRAFT_1169445 [Trametes gibbosa]|nr:hypothetical protein BC628DRAFT_1169445 [Trametes gibbosa]